MVGNAAEQGNAVKPVHVKPLVTTIKNAIVHIGNRNDANVQLIVGDVANNTLLHWARKIKGNLGNKGMPEEKKALFRKLQVFVTSEIKNRGLENPADENHPTCD